MNSDIWNKIYDEGYNSSMNGLNHSENPYPFSEDTESEYSAWSCGWIDADNDSYESQYLI